MGCRRTDRGHFCKQGLLSLQLGVLEVVLWVAFKPTVCQVLHVHSLNLLLKLAMCSATYDVHFFSSFMSYSYVH